MQYVMYQNQLKPSLKKGEIPDIVKVYVSNTSDIGWHFDITREIDKAYRFEDFESDDMKGYCKLLGMQFKPI